MPLISLCLQLWDGLILSFVGRLLRWLPLVGSPGVLRELFFAIVIPLTITIWISCRIASNGNCIVVSMVRTHYCLWGMPRSLRWVAITILRSGRKVMGGI